MRNSDIEKSIKGAMERLTPDVFDGVLAKCGNKNDNVFLIQAKKPKRSAVMRAAGALAAALVMTFGGLFAYSQIEGNRVDSLVMLDVNPSLEIRLNRNDRVIDVEAKNEDAVRVIDNMDLKNTPIDVAINALIGSMLKFGYIHENANSILLSVEGADHEKSVLLQRNLAQSISQQLNVANGAVISQALADDETLRGLAQANQISFGKAALVQKILDENSHLTFDELAQLSVNELNLLVSSKQIEAQGLEAQGTASDAEYIGYERAIQVALTHADISNQDITPQVEMDFDDGEMVYDIEFLVDGREYEYEINARDGVIIDYSQERADDGYERQEPKSAPIPANPTSPPQTETGFIGEDAAREIAAAHIGIAPHAEMQVDMDKDDGLYVYEVEFHLDGMEFSYEIDASTGDILSWEEDD